MKSIRLLSIIVVLLVGGVHLSSCQTKPGGEKLEVNDFDLKLKATPMAQVVDVRTPDEYGGGHLQNAKNIDWNGKDFEAAVQLLDKSKPTFVYCLSGGRSGKAAIKMRELGFTNLYEMQGGMLAWNKANKAIVKNEGAPASKGMSADEFNKQLATDKLVLVDFNAPWCEPCKKLAPILDEIATQQKERVQLLKINLDENKELAKSLQVDDLPTILIYKNGKQIWRHQGLVDKEDITKVIGAN